MNIDQNCDTGNMTEMQCRHNITLEIYLCYIKYAYFLY